MTNAGPPLTWGAGELRSFLARNSLDSPADIPVLDAGAAAGLDWSGSERATAYPAALAHRRIYNVARDIDVGQRMLDRGMHSAAQVASMPLDDFVREHADGLGVDTDGAAAMHRRATRIQNRTLHLMAAVHGVSAQPHFRALRVNNVSDEIHEHFQSLPSYQELFGSLDYCACDECKSIFGAAAYLVDLLRIVDERITTPNTIPEPFKLNARRPDLEKIELTCEKTNTTFPYLRIAIERLMERAEGLLGVKTREEVLAKLASDLHYPANLPFNVYLDQIRVLLDQVGLQFADVLDAWAADVSQVVREAVGLSVEQLEIVETPVLDPQAVAAFYGIDKDKLGELSKLAKFMEHAALSVPEVEDLVTQRLSDAEIAAGIAANLFVNQGAGAGVIELRTDKQGDTTIEHLDVSALDRVNRLRRLAAAFGWPMSVTDWLLRAVKGGGTPAIDATGLAGLLRVRRLTARFGLTPTQAATLFGPLKTYGKDGDSGGSLFDQLFNGSGASRDKPPYHPSPNPLNSLYTTEALEWKPGDPATLAKLMRVLPGFGLSLEATTALGRALFGETKTQLTVDTLSALYRHALLSRCLNLSMDQYLLLLDLTGLKGQRVFDGPGLDKLVAFWEWMVAAGLDVYQLAYVKRAQESVFVDPLLDESRVADWLRGLVTSIDPAADDSQTRLDAQVASFLGVALDVELAARPMAVSAVEAPAGKRWVQAFLAPIARDAPPPYLQYAKDVLRWIARWAVLAQAANVPAAVIACAGRHPAAFGLPTDFRTLEPDVLRFLQRFAAMIRAYGDQRGDLIAYVDVSSQAGPDHGLDHLHSATGWAIDQVKDLLDHEVKDANAVERLRRLGTCLEQAAAAGADVPFIRGLVALAPQHATDEKYAQQAELLLQKISAWYGPTGWAAISGQVHGRLQVHERDAVLGVVLAGLHAKYHDIRTPNNVYEFLLTDVEIGPEAQISYVKEALNAVQLYLQRCRLRLEPGVEKVAIPEVWWDWILNYRKWEANRQIFVYPENYLLPSIRRDQTAPFRQLASDLLQSEVTPVYVEKAYDTYLKTFMSDTQLVLVDSFAGEVYDEKRGGPADALIVFARTATSPYTFYMCRKLADTGWSEWEAIDQTISSTDVTPVYAFERLFLFWVQLDELRSPSVTLAGTDLTSTTATSYRTTIRYSFQDRSGHWVQPQTLAENQIVDFQGRGQDEVPLRKDPLFAGVFAMDALEWRKVQAVRVTGDSLAKGLSSEPDFERIVVVYGPPVNDVPSAVKVDGANGAKTPDAVQFEQLLRRRALEHDRRLDLHMAGQVPAGRTYVLDASLQPSVLVARNETLLTDPYWPAEGANEYLPALNRIDGAVQIVRSDTPVTDVYRGDVQLPAAPPVIGPTVNATYFVLRGMDVQTASDVFAALKTAKAITAQSRVDRSVLPGLDLYAALPALLDTGKVKPLQLDDLLDVLMGNAGAPVLFGAIGSSNVRVLTVKNQPGSFVVTTPDETLLLQPDRPSDKRAFSSLSDGLTVAVPPLNTGSFVMPSATPPVTYESSKKIYELLRGLGLIDARGFPLMPEFQGGAAAAIQKLVDARLITEDQGPLVLNVALDAPLVYPDAFAAPGIDAKVSGEIFVRLQDYSLIDENGRLSSDLVTSARVREVLTGLVNANKLDQGQVSRVYATLVDTPYPLAIGYINRHDPGPIVEQGKFTVTRLSTSAVPRLQRALLVGGIDALLARRMQNIPVVPILPFDRLKPAAARIVHPEALDAAQVDFHGLYERYFWELFFHGPMLVADALASNQQFLEALSWFRYVFDPAAKPEPVTTALIVAQTRQEINTAAATATLTELNQHSIGTPAMPIVDAAGAVNPAFAADTDLSFLKTNPELTDGQILMVRNVLLNERLAKAASRFWNFRPFRGHTLKSLKEMLTHPNAISAYENEPFDPFAIARLRMGAFEKATVMQYVDTLLRWGDYYFEQDTWESITAASMLYVYASDLLGPRPEQIGVCPAGAPKTFAAIRAAYKDKPIPEFLIYLESALPLVSDIARAPVEIQQHAFNDLGAYFCVPENARLVSYWDRVDDRLFKIRHSLDITGQYRALALFEPPLDPLALARAAGASNDLMPPSPSKPGDVPALRYDVLIERARALAASVTQLGAQILAAQERGDSEALALLQTTQQDQILALSTEVAEKTVDDAKATLAGLQDSLSSAQYRAKFYGDLIARNLNDSESLNLGMMDVALLSNILSSVMKTGASIAYGVPQVGSPFAMTYGGVQLGHIIDAAGGMFGILADIANYRGQRALTMAGYERRKEDWTLQKRLADDDVASVGKQIIAAQARLDGAKRQLVINAREIASTKTVESFLRTKFTNAELYGWMVGRLSGLHFQTYLLALQAAHNAQTAFQFEYDRTDTFFDVDVWDPARQGLLAGESLTHGLDRMAAAAVQSSRRALEIERIVSLGQLDPIALDALKTTGSCDFELPELMYDYDYPGHYRRQIKTISVSIPAVVGPYQNIRATLTQTWNATALGDDLDSVLYLMHKNATPPESVRIGWGGKQHIAISRGVDDSGLFQLDFHDARYLPFEGTGAVSKWKLELRPEANRFDLDQLTDVVLTVRYTAQPSETLKPQVVDLLKTTPVEVGYYVDARRSLPIEWDAFMSDHGDAQRQTLSFAFTPRWAGPLRKLELDKVLLRLTAGVDWPQTVPKLVRLKIGDQPPKDADVSKGLATVSGLHLDRDLFSGPWQVSVDLDVVRADPKLRKLLDGEWLNPDVFRDVELVDVCEATIW